MTAESVTYTSDTEHSDCPLCGECKFVTAWAEPAVEAECLTDNCRMTIFEVMAE